MPSGVTQDQVNFYVDLFNREFRKSVRGVSPAGLKALQVRVSLAKSYWVEYRTKFGVDSGFAPQGHGVVVRAVGR